MRAIVRSSLVGVAVMALTLRATSASADEGRPNAPLAEALFREGRELMVAHRLGEACPKLAESQRVDPRLGTLLNVATCHELEGRTATAWAEFTEAQRQAARAERADYERFARSHRDRLEPLLARLRVHRAEQTPDLDVQLDQKNIGTEALDTAFPIDPGEHTLAASAPGRVAWTERVRIEPAGVLTVTVPVLRVAPPAGAISAGAGNEGAASAPDIATTDGTRRFVGIAALGTAAVALGTGAYFGLRTFAKKSDGDALCHGTSCTQAGLDAHSEAHVSAVVSTVAFGVGLAASAIGLYALLTSSRSDASGVGAHGAHVAVLAHASPTASGLTLEGSW